MRHTGTDITAVPWIDNCEVQVSTYDGDKGGFAWIFGSTKGFIPFKDCDVEYLLDPDVVVWADPEKKDLYAYVAGIHEGLVRVLRYKCPNGSQKFSCMEKCAPLGATWESNPEAAAGHPQSGMTGGRECSSPNLDANARGQVVLTWTETEKFYVEITYGYPFINISQIVMMQRGNVLGAYGNMPDCLKSCGPRILYNEDSPYGFPGEPGMPVGQEPVVIGGIYVEDGQNPGCYFSYSDVAISENAGSELGSMVTFVFNKHNYNPISGNGTQLVTAQVPFGKCYSKDHYDYDPSGPTGDLRWEGYIGARGVPRISATRSTDPGTYRDFTVVTGSSIGGCDDEHQGNWTEYSIKMVAYRNNAVFNGGLAKVLNHNPDIRGYINAEPVVAHVNEKMGKYEDYIVSWTIRNHPEGKSADVIARMYTNGSDAHATGAGDAYSLVPEKIEDWESIPSIASRHSRYYAAYFWGKNFEKPYAKVSKNIPGIDALEFDLKLCGDVISPDRRANAEFEIKVMPNPASGAINYTISGWDASNNGAERSIRLFDAQGHLIQSLNNPAASGKVGGSAGTPLPSGLYILKTAGPEGARDVKVIVE